MKKRIKDKERDRARIRDRQRKAKNHPRMYHSRPSPGVSYNSNPSLQLPSFLNLNNSALAIHGSSIASRGQHSEPSGAGGNKVIVTMEKIAKGQHKSNVGVNSIVTLRLDQRKQKEFMKCYQDVCMELNVRHLNLSNNDIATFQIYQTIENLMTINLRNNRLKDFLQEGVVSKLPHLETLIMSENLISDLPASSLTILSNRLRKLDLSSNCLTSLPSHITVLEHLVKLDVSKNQISSLPPELLRWKLVENFHTSGAHFPALGAKSHGHSSISGELLLRGNKFKEPHQRHFDSKGLGHLRDYMAHTYDSDYELNQRHDHLSASGLKSHMGGLYSSLLRDYLKVVIVGHDGSGKSVISMALKQFHQVKSRSAPNRCRWEFEEEAVIIMPEFRNETLQCANIAYERRSLPTPHLTINLWDFMEKDVYQSSMDIFYSKLALHVVVWNVARASASCDAGQPAYHEVEYWINLIQARAPGSTILIVATHTDLLSTERSQFLIDGCREYLSTQEVKRLSALQSEIDRCDDEKEKFCLQQMLFDRPCLDLDNIIQLTYANGEISGGLDLVTRIILLSDSSCALAGCTLLPRANLYDQWYDDVKKAIDTLRREGTFACSIDDIKDGMRHLKGGALVFELEEDALSTDKQQELSDKVLRDALTYWMQAGDIVYLYDPSTSEDDGILEDDDDDDNGEETSLASSKLINQLPGSLSLPGSIHSETPTFGHSLEDRLSSMQVQHMLFENSTGTELGKDFNHSVNGGEDASSCATISPQLSIADIVFVSPNRFKKALLGILNKDPKLHIVELQKAPMQIERQGSDDTNSVAAPLDYRNGLVDWSKLQIVLKESSKWLLSPRCVSSESEVEKILTFLREALVYLEVLIPVKVDAPEQNIGERAFDSPETKHLLYVFPALLAEVDPRSYDVPQFAPSGLIKLEKSFELPKFAPIALIPKIMAKLFSRTSRRQNDLQIDEISMSSIDINKDRCQCFQTCFVQTIGERTLWVYLDHGNPSSPKSGLLSPVSPSSVKYHFAYNVQSQAADSSVSYTLRIVVYDYVFSVQQGVSELNDIQDIVIEVLESYKGLSKVNIVTYCPVCLMQQLPYFSPTFPCCGVISEEVEREAMRELDSMVDAYIEDQPSMEPEYNLLTQFQLWEAKKQPMCSNNCKFKAELFIPLPKEIVDLKTSSCVAQEIEMYLTSYFIEGAVVSTESDLTLSSDSSCIPTIVNPSDTCGLSSPLQGGALIGSQCDRIGRAMVEAFCVKCDQGGMLTLEDFCKNQQTASMTVAASKEFEQTGVSFHTVGDNQVSYFAYIMQPKSFNHKNYAWFVLKVGNEYFLYWYDHTFSNELSILLLSLVGRLADFTMTQKFTLNLNSLERDGVPQHSLPIDLTGMGLESAVLAYVGHAHAPAASVDVSFVLGRVFRYAQTHKAPYTQDSYVSYCLVNSYAGNPKQGSPVFRIHDDKLIGIVATHDINPQEPRIPNVFAIVPIDFFFSMND